MPNVRESRAAARLSFSILSAACLAGVFLSAPALAADDDDTSFEERVIHGLLKGMGVDTGRGQITYRERSPLVIPPSGDLPAPETTSVVSNPAWPKDPDVVERKKSSNKPRPKTIAELGDPGRPLTPQELKQGTVAGAGRVTAPGEAGPLTDKDIGRPLRPSELGYKGGLFKSLFSKEEQDEIVKFDGEPARTSLTQPPPGYMTPSATQPYGVVTRSNRGTQADPRVKDRAVGGD